MISSSKRSALRQPAFTRLWLGETATVLAYQMLVVAVGWQTYDLTDSALALGLIGLFHFSSQFLFLLPAGHIADRFDRRRIALAAQVVQLGVASMLAAASFNGALTSVLIYAGSFFIGGAQAFQSPSVRSMLPALVPRSELLRCIAWSGAARKMAVIAGPALGGLVYMLGPGYVYVLSAIFFVVSGVLLIGIPSIKPGIDAVKQDEANPGSVPHRIEPGTDPIKQDQAKPGSVPIKPEKPGSVPTLQTMFGGIAYIRQNRVVLGAISLDLFATLLGGTTALLPIYARDILQTGPSGLGMLRAAPALGALVVSILLVRAPLSRNVGRTMFACVAIFGVCTIVFGVSRSFALSLTALCVLGAADMISVVIRSSLIQLETPDHMRGRVSAVNSMFTSTSNQLGQFESGVAAALFGTVPAVVIGGVGTLLVAGLWMRWFPALYQRDVLTSRTGV
jgi:MFS family permease